MKNFHLIRLADWAALLTRQSAVQVVVRVCKGLVVVVGHCFTVCRSRGLNVRWRWEGRTILEGGLTA